MDTGLPLPFQNQWWTQKRLLLAVSASILLHVLLVSLLPSLRGTPPEEPQVLRVEIAPPPPKVVPPPPPAVEPPPPPRPPPPKPRVSTPPPKPAPSRPVAEPPPMPPPERVIATEPDIPRPAESIPFTVPAQPPPPSPVVQAPVLPPPPQPAPIARPDPGALEGYGRSLSAAISRYQRYPRIAQMRRWEGTAMVALRFSATGALLGAEIERSSGYEVLDARALDMVEEARPLPQAPTGVTGEPFRITVPIQFRLQR